MARMTRKQKKEILGKLREEKRKKWKERPLFEEWVEEQERKLAAIPIEEFADTAFADALERIKKPVPEWRTEDLDRLNEHTSWAILQEIMLHMDISKAQRKGLEVLQKKVDRIQSEKTKLRWDFEPSKEKFELIIRDFKNLSRRRIAKLKGREKREETFKVDERLRHLNFILSKFRPGEVNDPVFRQTLKGVLDMVSREIIYFRREIVGKEHPKFLILNNRAHKYLGDQFAKQALWHRRESLRGSGENH